MKLPDNYYHCFLGNGLDAVLIGYTGSMVADKVSVDRCVWYKSDRYYPEDKLVKVAGRFPMEKPLEHAEGSGWYEIAPLGRTWYDVSINGQKLDLEDSKQHFVPQEGILYSDLDFRPIHAQATTFLYARGSLLVEHYEFDHPVDFTGYMAPGVWVEEGWDTNPFYSVSIDGEHATGTYDLGETHGRYFMKVEPSSAAAGMEGDTCMLHTAGKSFTKYFAILDNRQGSLDESEFARLTAPGYNQLLADQKEYWGEYFSHSKVHLPDPQFQMFYDASTYHFKAIQNPVSGGLPVNNLRRTWSSHIFWDSYYIQRALLESNHINEALEGIRFFERTMPQARRHAEVEFGCPGLKWDWEITHDGRKAYGSLLHMKFQVHNNGSYANEFWQQYLFTRDEAVLHEFFPLLEGLATFFMKGIVIEGEHGWEIGPLVGVHESPIKVRNEGTSLAATIDILEHYSDAAAILNRENDFSRQCREVARDLRARIDALYNGRFFSAAEGFDQWTTSSTAVIYPLQVIDPSDPRALTTSAEIMRMAREVPIHNEHKWESAWADGVEATILALQGKGEDAWKVLQLSRPCMCEFGGMTEVRIDDQWNMQYFCTAQAAVMTAFHMMLLQGNEAGIHVFPAIPAEWSTVSFENLISNGLAVSAALANGNITGSVRNISPVELSTMLHFKGFAQEIHLKPGEEYAFKTA
jgi:hypothetical protein